jgi:alpha-mannosidase
VARLELGGEGLVFDREGVPLQGLSTGSIFDASFLRERFPLFETCRGGEEVELWVEAAAQELFGMHLLPEPARDDPERYGGYEARLNRVRLSVFRREVWQLSLDARVLLDTLKALPESSVRRARILHTLTRAAELYGDGSAGVEAARALLHPELARPASSSDLLTTAVGHAHIDTAWLWPLKESIRKTGRSFASQLRLLERYPEYVFGASAAQHYLFAKQHYPALYEQLKAMVKKGRWEVLGAGWVESDCNLAGGESLVRQILYGKQFFAAELGVEPRILWLPDTFGFPASLPQIMARSGVPYFLTVKISWNQFNRFPHHSFRWRGIDGSEVLAHFPPSGDYNATMSPAPLIKAQQAFEEKDRLEEFLTAFGIGDGGGGPKEEHIELGLRQRSLEGCPQVRFGGAHAFFERLAQKRDLLATWSGPLYLELHRATFTTQGRNKRYNRRLELALREVEMLYACLPLKHYPAQELLRLWRELLVLQFHDVLPGSGIHRVYEDSLRSYEELEAAVERLRGQAASLLLRQNEESLTFVNTLSSELTAAVTLPERWSGQGALSEAGEQLPSQQEEGRTVLLVRVAPLSALTVRRGGSPGPAAPAGAAGKPADLTLENERIRYRFSERGTLDSAFDKELQREMLAGEGKGNVLSLYHDLPLQWDAWDVDLFYERQLLEQARLTGWRRSARGPVRAGLELQLEAGASTIRQRVLLRAGSKRLDFETEVDWKERRKMLRVSFTVDVLAEQAAFDIQYGTVRRSTRRNTSWETAQFEVPAHRFADLSQGDCGAALLSDCKYGYRVQDNLLDLNLLRSPVNPDPDADLGRHVFTYSFLPHAGDLSASEVFAEAAALNQGVALFDGLAAGSAAGFAFPCRLSGEGVVTEVLKKSENGESLILRAYETRGREARAELRLADPGTKVWETDLMEREERSLSEGVKDGEASISLRFRPYQIRTFKLGPPKRKG